LFSYIDHIVIVAPSLDTGIKYVYESLGVLPQKGGAHYKMGTHNYLLNLGHSMYLEVIAINPNAPKPDGPRWFALDKLEADAKPKLLTWVVRTDDVIVAKQNSLIELGNIETMSREDMNWLITIPSDGSLPCNGVAPSLIQWLNVSHPSSRLDDSGCSLVSIEGFHPKAKAINATLQFIGLKSLFSTTKIGESEKPFLTAYIQTPKGICKLE
jgi:Glyoxalase-like domain